MYCFLIAIQIYYSVQLGDINSPTMPNEYWVYCLFSKPSTLICNCLFIYAAQLVSFQGQGKVTMIPVVVAVSP